MNQPLGENKPLYSETILIVDDEPLNITILSNLLKDHYKIKIAKNGESALRVIDSDPNIDLILLDIIMPDLSGYQVCEKIKANERTKDIPVIFASSLTDINDIVTGFNAGGVDYIVKPYKVEEVMVRVGVHIELKRMKAEVQSLLSKTLVGSVKLLIDLIGISQPELIQQSTRIRKYARPIIEQLKVDSQEAWSIELAIMLSQIGCITFSKELMDKVVSQQKLSKEEYAIYEQYPVIGARLIEHIPRMERTATIIKNQMINPNKENLDMKHADYIGVEILNILNMFDMRLRMGEDEQTAFQKVNQLYPKGNSAVYAALRNVIEGLKHSATKQVPYTALRAGHILAMDITLRNGTLLITKDTELNQSMIDMIGRLHEQGQIAGQNLSVYLG